MLVGVGCLCVLIAHIKLSSGHPKHNRLGNFSELKPSKSLTHMLALNQF